MDRRKVQVKRVLGKPPRGVGKIVAKKVARTVYGTQLQGEARRYAWEHRKHHDVSRTMARHAWP